LERRRPDLHGQVAEIEAAHQHADQRHHHVLHHRGDDLAEGGADDHADSEVHHVAFDGELAELLDDAHAAASVRVFLVDLVVAHFEDFELFDAAGRPQHHGVSLARLDERLGDRRYPRYPVARRIGFVHADDGDGLFAVLASDFYRRTKKHLLALPPRGVHHLGGLQALDQETHAAVDLAQPLLAVQVVAVL